jgi:hypothetical protein
MCGQGIQPLRQVALHGIRAEEEPQMPEPPGALQHQAFCTPSPTALQGGQGVAADGYTDCRHLRTTGTEPATA